MSQTASAYAPTLGSKLVQITRVHSWWSYKFSPVLATFYATACFAHAPVWPLVPRLLLLLGALVVGAIYVSVINDWTDLDDDRLGGKYNHMADRSKVFPALLILGCLLAGLGMGVYFWHWNPVSSLLYLGSWVAFSLYSLPPIRVKNRGLLGVLADASGSHLFPQLLTASLAAAWTGYTLPILWYVALGTWAWACGIRNILLHQLDDVEADAKAGVYTWVRVRGPQFTRRIGQAVIFPVEVVSFSLLLVLNQQLWPALFLLPYLLLEGFKWRLWGNRAQVLEPGARVLLNEYYEVFYPLGLLLVLSSQHTSDLLVLGLHLLLFGRCFWQTAKYLGWAGALTARKTLDRLY